MMRSIPRSLAHSPLDNPLKFHRAEVDLGSIVAELEAVSEAAPLQSGQSRTYPESTWSITTTAGSLDAAIFEHNTSAVPTYSQAIAVNGLKQRFERPRTTHRPPLENMVLLPMASATACTIDARQRVLSGERIGRGFLLALTTSQTYVLNGDPGKVHEIQPIRFPLHDVIAIFAATGNAVPPGLSIKRDSNCQDIFHMLRTHGLQGFFARTATPANSRSGVYMRLFHEG
jgi:hypothetical protein